MTQTNWLSPVQLLDTKVLGLSLNIEEGFAGGETHFFLTMNSNLGLPEVHDGALTSKCVLEATGNWLQSANADADPAFTASCKLGITVAIPEAALESIPEEDRKDFILANSVSIAYGKIRAVIESITSESPVGRQTLPTIDPYALVKSMRKVSQ